MWKLSHLHVWHCIVLRGELRKSNNNTIFVVVDPNNICMYILPILEFIYKTTDNSNNMRLHSIWMKFKLAHIHKQTHIYSHAFNQSLNHLIKVLFNPLQRWVRFLTIWTYIHIYISTRMYTQQRLSQWSAAVCLDVVVTAQPILHKYLNICMYVNTILLCRFVSFHFVCFCCNTHKSN